MAPSTQSRPHLGLFFSASTLVRSGPVLSSSSSTVIPVAFWNAVVSVES